MHDRLRKLGATSFVVAGALVLAKNVLELDALGGYPWAIGLALWGLSDLLFSTWLILIGASLARFQADGVSTRATYPA